MNLSTGNYRMIDNEKFHYALQFVEIFLQILTSPLDNEKMEKKMSPIWIFIVEVI